MAAAGFYYVLDIRRTERVFTQRPATALPAWTGRGRKPQRERRVPESAAAQTVVEGAAAIPEAAWCTLTVAEGAHGPRRYQFVGHRVWECRDDLPGRAGWLVLRRPRAGGAVKYARSNALATIPLVEVGASGAIRWNIETAFEWSKSAAGLVEYAVRSWEGWYHPMSDRPPHQAHRARQPRLHRPL